MGSLKNCGIVRGQRSGNLFLHRQPFFDRGSRSEGSGQILLVGAKVGRHCRSSRLCCEGLQVGRRGRQHLCWSGLQVGGGRVGGMGGFAVRWDGWCSRGGGMSLKNGGFSSRPPATLLRLITESLGRRTRRLITEILVGGGAPHNGDLGRRKNGTSPLFLNALGQLTDGWGHLGRWLQVGGGGASWGV